MALIRTARLFTAQVGPSAGAVTSELGGPRMPSPDPAAWTQLYECPAGYRAIIRNFTVVLYGAVPISEEPACYLNLEGAPITATIYFNWFVDRAATSAVIDLFDSWSCHVVMYGGDRLQFFNATTNLVMAHASGALLPEP